ncbi:eukaryotic translation initiation factor 2-alpha kinase 3-like, partial [Tropilaelaps mercedesae]
DDVEVDHTLPSVLPTMVEEPAEAHIEGAHRTQRTTEDNEWPDESVEDAPIIYVVNSLGNYWREIAIISIICSVAVNILLTRILPRLGWRSPEEPPALMAPHSAVQTVLSGSGESVREVTPTTTAGSSTKTVTPSDRDLQPTVASTALSRSESAESSSVVNAANFVSRYVTDFVPVRCLGKGGFGIVFESRNKIDDCSYAVKRIRLPARQGAREKVLREVKALAKLDHQHIVRYYNSWLETPPAGWQQDMDAVWRTTLPVSTTNALSTGVDGTPAETGTTTANESSEPADSVGHCQQDAGDAKDIRKLVDGFNPFRPFDAILDSWQSSEPDQRPDKDVTQEDNSGGSGSWASDLVDQVVVASDSDDDVDAENEHQDDGDNLSASSGIDGLNRQENEDSIVFASDDRSSLSRFGALVTRRRKSDNVPLCDENALRVWGDEEVLKENDSKDINKNDKNNKITARKRPNSLPPLAGGMADAATENPRQTVYLYIQIELCKKESLKDWLAEKKTLDERGHDKVLEIFYQISLAVEYVHESGLIHRDLKPSNIFFATAGDVVKVGDFGLVTGTEGMVGITSIPAGTPGAHGDVSTRGEDASDVQSVRFDRQLTDKVGTQLYMSHEQVAGSKYNQKVDIFALGLILFELLWSLPTQMERVRTLSAVKQLRFPKGFKREFQDEYQLVRSMLAADPSLRPTAQEVLRHSLFNEIRQNSAKRLRHRTNSSRNSHSSHEGASSVR